MEVCHTSQIIHKNLLFRATSWMPFVSNRYSTIEIIRLSCEIYSTYWMKMNLEWRCDMWCCTIHIEFNAKHWMVHCLVFFHRSQIQKVNRKSICVCVYARAHTHFNCTHITFGILLKVIVCLDNKSGYSCIHFSIAFTWIITQWTR